MNDEQNFFLFGKVATIKINTQKTTSLDKWILKHNLDLIEEIKKKANDDKEMLPMLKIARKIVLMEKKIEILLALKPSRYNFIFYILWKKKYDRADSELKELKEWKTE